MHSNIYAVASLSCISCPFALWLVSRPAASEEAAIIDALEGLLDPFNGSGTTGVAALELGRRYVGLDLDPDYLEVARRRLEAAR